MDNTKFKFKQMLSFIAFMLLSVIVLMIVLLFFPVGEQTSVAQLKLLQLVQSISLFIIPAFLWSFYYTKSFTKGLFMNNMPKLKDVCLVVVLMLTAEPAINFLGWLNQQISLPPFMADVEIWMQQLETEAEQMTLKLLQGNSIGDLLVNLFVIAFVPALGEEMTFRGVLMQIFTIRNSQKQTKFNHSAIWMCAIIFSFIHFQFYGFIPRMLIGALFGYLLFYSGSLWLPIIAHFTNNATVVIITYIYQISSGKPLSEMQDMGTENTWWVGLISLFVAFIGFYLLLRSQRKVG